MECLVLPISMLTKCYKGSSRLAYRPIAKDGFCNFNDGPPVTVVVGKEKREFLVDPFVLEESPFRFLIETVRKDGNYNGRFLLDDDNMSREKRVIFMDHVDAILFEHMLWLMHNDASSLFQLNLKEIIDFYTQDY